MKERELEGIRLLTDGIMIETGWIILTIAVLMAFLFWNGRYKVFEKVLTLFVLIMVSCFFMVSPSLSSIFPGMVPSIPDVPGAFGLAAAMAGTTCSAAVFIGWLTLFKNIRGNLIPFNP